MSKNYRVQRGNYKYRNQTYREGMVYYKGGFIATMVFFFLYPVGRGKVYFKKNDSIKWIKNKYGITKYRDVK